MAQLRIALASDHGGFEQKEELKPWLGGLGFIVDDFGCDSEESVDYPDYAKRAARAVARGDDDYGVLVCGTGIGMMIAANKVHGVRAANLTSTEFAKLSREHNNANIATLSGRFTSLEDNKAILETFLGTEFSGDRHARRVEKIMTIETEE